MIDRDRAVESLTEQDWVSIKELTKEYACLHMGGTDASLIAIADQSLDRLTPDEAYNQPTRPPRAA